MLKATLPGLGAWAVTLGALWAARHWDLSDGAGFALLFPSMLLLVICPVVAFAAVRERGLGGWRYAAAAVNLSFPVAFVMLAFLGHGHR